MCATPSIGTVFPPQVPAPVAPPPQAADPQVVAAGTAARNRAAAAAGPMSLIVNMGGPQGLTAPPQTTGKQLTGQ